MPGTRTLVLEELFEIIANLLSTYKLQAFFRLARAPSPPNSNTTRYLHAALSPLHGKGNEVSAAEELPDLPDLVSGGVQAPQPLAWPCIPPFSKYLLATKQKRHWGFFPSKQTAFWRGHFFPSAGDKGEQDLAITVFLPPGLVPFLPLHYTPQAGLCGGWKQNKQISVFTELAFSWGDRP